MIADTNQSRKSVALRVEDGWMVYEMRPPFTQSVIVMVVHNSGLGLLSLSISSLLTLLLPHTNFTLLSPTAWDPCSVKKAKLSPPAHQLSKSSSAQILPMNSFTAKPPRAHLIILSGMQHNHHGCLSSSWLSPHSAHFPFSHHHHHNHRVRTRDRSQQHVCR